MKRFIEDSPNSSIAAYAFSESVRPLHAAAVVELLDRRVAPLLLVPEDIKLEICRAAQRISDIRLIERHDQDLIFPAHLAEQVSRHLELLL